MKKLVLVLALILCLIGCGISEQTEATEVAEITREPIECVYSGKGGISILVDTKTNVMYLKHSFSQGISVVMLVNADGTPRLYEGEFDDAE